MIITVDGQSSSGKSTLAGALAHKLGYHFLGSGSIYRLIAYAKLQDIETLGYIEILKKRLKFSFEAGEMRVLVGSEDMTVKLSDNEVTQLASEIAKDPELRQRLLELQKSFNQLPGLVAEGRDMGTVVFPDAAVKFFLVSDINVRAKRRLRQLKLMGIEHSLKDEVNRLTQRDERDENREISPLKIAEGSYVLDTSLGTIEESLELMLQHVQSQA